MCFENIRNFEIFDVFEITTPTGLPNPSRETKFSDANGDREKFIFPVKLTTCRIGNLIRLIHSLAIRVTIYRTPPRNSGGIWSREMGSAVPSRVSLLISPYILRLNLVSSRVPRRRPFIYLKQPYAIGTQLRDPIDLGLTRWHMSVLNN